MSGIAGIIHFDRMPVQAGQIESMTAAMAHRGPDGIAHWREGSAALGHCLLRTTRESADERQPLIDADRGLVLTFDGRIDNAMELARDLKARGAMLRTRADSELVLRAYEQWGDALLDHLEGDFAFAAWDPHERRLLCARDRVGNKPLHYFWNGTTFAFASDVRALLALPWIQRRLNLDFVAENLAEEWLTLEDTFWEGIRRLPPAHRLVASSAGLDTQEYWRPRLDISLPYRSLDEYAEHYRDLLLDVVRRMGRSSGPVACEVSGGLDSSALFAVACDLQRRGDWPAPDVHGYTLDFRGAGDADEMDYAQAVARHVGKTVTEIQPTRQPLTWYEDWAKRHGYPAGYPNGVMGLGIRLEARRRGSNCLLVGVGGDEWLDGYPSYFAEAIAGRQWRELWQRLKLDGREFGMPQTSWSLLRYGVGPLLPDPLRHAIHAIRRRSTRHEGWLTAAMTQRLVRQRSRLARTDTPVRRVGQRSHLLQLQSAYSLLARETEERLGAWTGLEIRRPLWSTPIIEFALATPESLRTHGSRTKVVHRRAMAGLLPESVLERRTKADFMAAFQWSSAEIRDSLTRAMPDLSDWVSSDRILSVLQQCDDPRQVGSPQWRAWALHDCHSVRAAASILEDRIRDRTQA